jgi:hypothetical protein
LNMRRRSQSDHGRVIRRFVDQWHGSSPRSPLTRPSKPSDRKFRVFRRRENCQRNVKPPALPQCDGLPFARMASCSGVNAPS